MNTYLYFWLKEPWTGLTAIGFRTTRLELVAHMKQLLAGKYSSLIVGGPDGVFEQNTPEKGFTIFSWEAFVGYADRELVATA
jgi:hypothetical protein